MHAASLLGEGSVNDNLIKQLGLKNQGELDTILNYTGMDVDELTESLKKGDIIDILYGNNIDFSALDDASFKAAKNAGLKPSNSPTIENWTEKGGMIEMNVDGNVWKYTDKAGNVVFYRDGYPDFYNFKHPDVMPVSIDIAQPKNNGLDFKNANEAAGLGPDSIPPVYDMNRPPEGYTWHHMEDGKTMILVDSEIHKAFKHTGGQSVVNGKGGN